MTLAQDTQNVTVNPTDAGDDEGTIARVNSAYRMYLTGHFEEAYYRKRYDHLITTSQHFDFVIALGAALSGGTGLGILADARFAWVCGVVTAASVLIAAFKGGYKWPEKLKVTLEILSTLSKLNAQASNLVDDIQHRKTWNDDFEARYKKLRDEYAAVPVYPFPHWSDEKLREIQNDIKNRKEYRKFWNWR